MVFLQGKIFSGILRYVPDFRLALSLKSTYI